MLSYNWIVGQARRDSFVDWRDVDMLRRKVRGVGRNARVGTLARRDVSARILIAKKYLFVSFILMTRVFVNYASEYLVKHGIGFTRHDHE